VIAKPLGLDVEGVKANFLNAYQEEGAQHQLITGAPIPSTQETETYKWLDELNAFDYWDDKGAIPEATSNLWSYDLKNRPYGANWTVSEHEVRLDKIGAINLRARQMGSAAAHWYNDRLAATMEGATSGNLFDGVPFFSASHPTGATTVANYYTTGYELTQTNLETVIANMRGFTGRSGKRLGVRPSHLIVPPELEFTAKRILLTNQEAAGGTRADSDVLKGRVELIVFDALTDANAWYVADLTKPIRPFFMQELLGLRVLSQGPSDLSDQYIQSRVYTFSADGECAFGKSLWFLCSFCNPS